MQAFLTLRGLSRFDSIQGVILSDRQFLQSRLQLSASYSSSRGLLSLTVFRTTSDSGVGGRSTTANDDFSLSPVITQRGWTANYNHKVSALSSVNLSLTSSKSDGQAGTGINADRDVLNATCCCCSGSGPSGRKAMPWRSPPPHPRCSAAPRARACG